MSKLHISSFLLVILALAGCSTSGAGDVPAGFAIKTDPTERISTAIPESWTFNGETPEEGIAYFEGSPTSAGQSDDPYLRISVISVDHPEIARLGLGALSKIFGTCTDVSDPKPIEHDGLVAASSRTAQDCGEDGVNGVAIVAKNSSEDAEVIIISLEDSDHPEALEHILEHLQVD